MSIEDKFEKMAEYILRVNGERNKGLIQLALGEFRSALRGEQNRQKMLDHNERINRGIIERKDKDMEFIQNVLREEEHKRAINCFKIYK